MGAITNRSCDSFSYFRSVLALVKTQRDNADYDDEFDDDHEDDDDHDENENDNEGALNPANCLRSALPLSRL